MSGARSSKGRGGEEMGHIVGGHQRLIDAMVERAARARGRDHAPARRSSGLTIGEDGSVTGVELDGESLEFDLTIATLQPPALRFLLPERHRGLLEPYPRALARGRLPDPQAAALAASLLRGEHLRRRRRSPASSRRPRCSAPSTPTACASSTCPSTATPDAPEQSEDDESVYRRFTDFLARISPGFSRDDVVDWTVQRAKLVEPVHALRRGPQPAHRAGLARRRGSRARLQRADLPRAAQRRLGDGLRRTGRRRGRRAPQPCRDVKRRKCEKRTSWNVELGHG